MIIMNDFKLEPQLLRHAMLNAVARVMESGWYILGAELETFERRWAAMCGVRFGIGVGNGLEAIEIALRAIKISPEDEVITTSMTAFATVLGIIRAGATPVLADIEPESALLSIASVRRCVTSRTRAVVLVHLYGQIAANMDAWRDFCMERDIILIEDCAQAHLATLQGRPAGAFGRIGAFSFYPTKNLGALGDAGMLVTNNEVFARTACRLRHYGQSQYGHHSELGLNSRLDEIQAAILLERLQWLEEFTNARRAVAAAYLEGIRSPMVQPLAAPAEHAAHVYHLFVVTCAAREPLQKHLQQHGVQSQIHYPVPVHHQKPCRTFMRDPQGLPQSEQHANTCLSLPCHPHLTSNQIATVIDAVNSFSP